MRLHLWWLALYSAALVAVGVWIGRRVATTSEFFVAGRRLGPGLLSATLLAANIGAGSTVGAAGLAYRDGLSAWWWVGSAGLGSLVLAWWVGPRLQREAARRDLRTVGDYLEVRYGPAVRAVIAALLWIGTLFILAGQLIAGARVLEAVARVPKGVGCLVSGAVMTTYFAAGGLRTAVVVNAVQLAVLLGGFAAALVLPLAEIGGLAGLRAATPHAEYWSLGGASGWRYLVMLAPSFIVSPGLIQKIYGARDEGAVRVGVTLNAVALLLFAFVPVGLGAVARAQHPDLASPELALPVLLVEDLPVAVGALGLAALYSAEMSTADAILFMLATSLSQDLYRRFVHPTADDRRLLAVARGAAVAGGVLGVGLAVVAETVIDALSIFYTVLSVSLFVPLLAGLATRRPGSRAALAAIAAGTAVMLGVQLATAGRGVGWVTPALAGILAAAAGFGLAAFAGMARRRRTRRP
jgi:SSS family solute:Na+ symporter